MNKTERIFKIEQLIAARRVVSFRTLQDELEVSRATLKRDLEYLRSRMKAPIVYDRDQDGYRFDGQRGRVASPASGSTPPKPRRSSPCSICSTNCSRGCCAATSIR